MSRLGNYTRVALPTIGRIADYIIATHVRDRNARYVLVFMCCGWATTEVVLAASGLRIGREVYFDRTVGKECLGATRRGATDTRGGACDAYPGTP